MGWRGILGFDYGIVQAPLGPDLSGPELVAAVANAGAIGFLRAPDWESPDYLRDLIRKTRTLTSRPFGVGIVLAFPHEENIKVILEEKVSLLYVAWGQYPKELTSEAQKAGVRVVHQLDVKNAFLHGDLQEEVYMEQPPGYVSSQGSSLVCRLRKAIYGLKQSPRAWFDKFSGVVIQLGFSRFHADHSVFIRRTNGRLVVLAVYVDDIIITGDDVGGIQDLKSHLHTHFHTKDLGLLRYFLGIEVARSRGRMVLSQRKYVTDLLEETGMSGTKPMDTPMEPNIKLDVESGEIFDDPGQYRRLVGKLIYLTVTRPDIAFAVGIVSQFMHAPRQPHWEAVCRILRYLKAAPGRGLVYRSSGHLRVSGYSDADWAGQPDRRSISGYCTFVGGNLVTWRSKKQNVVARSSAEAEYRAMAHTTSEMLWVHSLVEALGFATNNPMEMFCDNQAAIHIANNPMFHERTKHVEVDCHFIRDMVMKKCITTPFVRSTDQLGDIFTKALGRVPFDELCNKLGLLDIYAPA